MRKTLHLKIEKEMDGLMIKAVLKHNVQLSRREVSRLKFAENGIMLNGNRAKITAPVAEGDDLEINFPERDTSHAIRILGKPDILYEDEDMVIVDKPAGMPCHPSHEHLDDDMGTLLKNYYQGQFTIRPIGRLDKDVSGVMLYAKNQPAAARLSRERKEDLLHKEYLAVAEGIFEQKKGTLKYALKKEEGQKDRKISADGQECITNYEVIQEYGDVSLLKVTIVTGRTHQIRAGMAYAGHPLCGDRLYGGKTEHITRPALHCASLKCVQPFTKKAIMCEAEMPQDMKAVIERSV